MKERGVSERVKRGVLAPITILPVSGNKSLSTLFALRLEQLRSRGERESFNVKRFLLI